MTEIRDARAVDLAAILEITNDAIEHSTAMWTLTRQTLDDRRQWMDERRAAGLPVLVAVNDDDAVLGFGSYGPFRAFEGYRHTVEHSVYIGANARRQGIGRLMLEALIAHAQKAGRHVMIGAVAADNHPSIALHSELGFQCGPVLPQVGRKFDQWLDLLLMYRRLDEDTAAEPVINP